MLLQKNVYSPLFTFLVSCVLLISACKSAKESTSVQSNTSSENKEAPKSIQEKYAKLLGVSPSEINNSKLYTFIDNWYGVPYKYGGKNKNGIDCSNFSATLYATVYNQSITGSSASIFKQCKPISKADLKEGDLLFFKIETDDISHIGVYLQNNKFVHATTKKGVMIDALDEPYYKKYFYKGGRITNN